MSNGRALGHRTQSQATQKEEKDRVTRVDQLQQELNLAAVELWLSRDGYVDMETSDLQDAVENLLYAWREAGVSIDNRIKDAIKNRCSAAELILPMEEGT